MQILEVTIDVGVGARPLQIEALVRAVRVAVDIGEAAELARIQRSASERLKFPTDRELGNAIERLPQGDEASPQYRARRLLDTRRELYERARSLPPELWWDYLQRDPREAKRVSRLVSGTGYERAFESSPLPWFGAANLGLDVLDPDLYAALVAEEVARLSPPEVTVRSMRYENPFGEELAAVDRGAAALTKVAGVIETSATLGSRRKIAKSEAAVAEATIDARIALSQLDAEVKREELRERRLANALAEEELLAKRIENAQALDALGAQRRQRALVEHFAKVGKLDEADAIAAASPSDAAALREFAVRNPELTSSYEPDPDDDL